MISAEIYPAWSRLSADRRYKDGLSLPRTEKHPIFAPLVLNPYQPWEVLWQSPKVDPSSTTIAMVDGRGSPPLPYLSIFTSQISLCTSLFLETSKNTQSKEWVQDLRLNSGRLLRGDCQGVLAHYLIEASMTRKRSSGSLHPLDPKIEKTLSRIKKTKNMHIEHTGDRIHSIIEIDNFEMKPDFLDNPLYGPDPMENNNNRTLKELAMLDILYQPWCIQYPQLDLAQTYELKFGLIHSLPKFHGLVGEDPQKHLKQFHVVYYMMRPQGIPKDCIKMKAFPLSLDGVAKDWLYLQVVVCTT
ncbi:hypothetical protein CR513_16916, partial [Mucuna pruriens]